MKKLIHFFVVCIFSVNTFAAYWPQNQEIPIQIERNSTHGAEFFLGAPITTQYELGKLYYFRDNEGHLYQGIFNGGDGKNSQWIHMSLVSEQSVGGLSPATNLNGGYFSGDTHSKAMGAAISAGVAHAIYKGVIFDGAFRGELNKLSEETRLNQEATQNNYKRIAEGVAAQGVAVRAALDEYSKSLNAQLDAVTSTITQYTSPSPEFVTNLRELEEILQLNRSTVPRRIEARSWGLHMLRQADNASTRGDQTDAQAFLKYAEAFADIAIGLDPITGPIRDVYEAFTGKNLITGETLDTWDRGFAILGAVTFGFGSKVAKGIKALRNLGKIVDGERAISRAVEIDAHITRRLGPPMSPDDPIYQRLLEDFRKPMTRPVVTDPGLKENLHKYWRDTATIGNGSTAAAYRWERMTGESVGGKDHAQKTRNSLNYFRNWLRENPKASTHDRMVVEELILDIQAALEGTK